MEEVQYNQKEEENFQEFSNNIRKVRGPRKHKIKGSYGIYDGFKYYRKIKPKNSEYVLTESQYFHITRRINRILGDKLLEGEDITFPYRLGRLEIRKEEAKIVIKDEKIKTNLPIDWNRTLKLWYEDQESYKNKTLIRAEEKEVYRVYYNRYVAEYTNKTFYQFNVNRDLKRRLKESIKERKLPDAFNLKGHSAYLNI